MAGTVESINDSGPSHRGRGHDSPPADVSANDIV
ncbi:unnamed protein product [Arabidopsis halleri]